MSTLSTPSLHIDTVLSYASDNAGHESIITRSWTVSYTHLTLPTNREV